MSSENTPSVQESAESEFLDMLTARQKEGVMTVFKDPRFLLNTGPLMFIDDAELYSQPAVTAYRRNYGQLSKILAYEYIYRSWRAYDQEVLNNFENLVQKKFDSTLLGLKKVYDQIDAFMQTNGNRLGESVYPLKFNKAVPITSNFSRAYLMVLRMLDKVLAATSEARLQGVIDSKQAMNYDLTAKRGHASLVAAIRNEVVKVYKEAKRAASAPYPVMPAAEAAQGVGAGATGAEGVAGDANAVDLEEQARLASIVNSQGADLESFDKTVGAGSADDPEIASALAAGATEGARAGTTRKKATTRAAEPDIAAQT